MALEYQPSNFGYIKPKLVLFGESISYVVIEGALDECRQTDCLIVVGSSLLISPANYMPPTAKKYGAQLIFINRENIIMDDITDIFLKGSAGEIFTELLKEVKSIS